MLIDENVINKLWDCRIISVDYSVLSGEIKIEVKTEKGVQSIVVNNVSLFFYVENPENSYICDSYAEFSEIYCEKGKLIKRPQKCDWITNYQLDYNLFIASVNRAFFIKAQSVLIGGVKYDLP